MVIADPALAALASNGGPTKTYGLLVGSAAIDGGATCGQASDQRYVARPQGVSCDIDAFEPGEFAAATLAIVPNVAVDTRTRVATLTGTVTCSARGVIGSDVMLSPTQKTTGSSVRPLTRGTTTVDCVGTSSWSITLTPSTGKLEKGAATVSATTSRALGFLPSTVTSTVKVFAVK